MLQFFNQQVHTSLLQITPPSVEPVTLAQAKNQCRVDSDITQDDALITSLIVAARRLLCDAKLSRAIVTQTWQYNLDIFPFFGVWSLPMVPIVLPLPPVQSIISVNYVQSDGSTVTLPIDQYQVDLASQPARIAPLYGQPWPITNIYSVNSVQIQFVCGYGLPTDNPATIPATIQQAILLLVGHWYAAREAVSDVSLSCVPMAVESLLAADAHGFYA